MPLMKRQLTPAERRATPVNNVGGANPDDAAGVNINTLVAQYRKNGTMPQVNLRNPLYGDFTGPQDLHRAMEHVQAAQDRFAELPADVRSAADNDPVKFLELFEDPAQRALLEEAGLIINPTPEPSPSPISEPLPEGGEPDGPPSDINPS